MDIKLYLKIVGIQAMALTVLLLSPAYANAQTYGHFQYLPAGTKAAGTAFHPTSDGGWILTGHTCCGGGNTDIFLVKVNDVGVDEWTHRMDAGKTDVASDVVQTPDDGYVVVGVSRSFSTDGSSDMYVLKLSQSGSVEWSARFGGAFDHDARQVLVDGDYIVVVGDGDTPGSGDAGPRVIHMSKMSWKTGALEWSRTFAFTGWAYAYSIARDAISGAYFVLGYMDPDSLLLRVTPAGILEWAKTLDTGASGVTDDRGIAIDTTPDGRLVLLGYRENLTSLYVMKVSTAGVVEWAKEIAEEYPNGMYEGGIAATSDSGLVITAQSWNDDRLVMKLDTTGQFLWSRFHDAGTVISNWLPLQQSHWGDVAVRSDGTLATFGSVIDGSGDIHFSLNVLDEYGLSSCSESITPPTISPLSISTKAEPVSTLPNPIPAVPPPPVLATLPSTVQSTCVSQPCSPLLSDPKLVAWWPFDEAAGTVAHDIAADDVSTANDGEHAGTVQLLHEPGVVGRALEFPGGPNSAYVSAERKSSPHNYASLTLDAWIKVADVVIQPFMCFESTIPPGQIYCLHQFGAELTFGANWSGGGSFSATSVGAKITADTWTHVAVTADAVNGEVKFYSNGQLVSTAPYSAGALLSGDVWHIGDQFKGLADEIEVFERVLTSAEILEIYQARERGKCKPDGWISDTPYDIGSKPPDTGDEPNIAGHEIWKAKAVWVRDTLDQAECMDPKLKYAHENPSELSTVSVCVEVVNRGYSPASGSVDVRIADGSTVQVWDTSFTQAGPMDTLSGIPPGGSAIAVVPWNTPKFVTNMDHFCVLARWVSVSDPMTWGEPQPSDNYFNVVNNNNSAQRNVNIIDPDKSIDSGGDTVSFYVRSVLDGASPINLLFRPSANRPIPSFFRHGDVDVELSDTLYERWMAAGGEGNGFEPVAGTHRLRVVDPMGASVRGLELGARETGTVSMTFRAHLRAPAGSYLVDAVQMSEVDGQETIQGGMSYDIRLPRGRQLFLPMVLSLAERADLPRPTALPTSTPAPTWTPEPTTAITATMATPTVTDSATVGTEATPTSSPTWTPTIEPSSTPTVTVTVATPGPTTPSPTATVSPTPPPPSCLPLDALPNLAAWWRLDEGAGETAVDAVANPIHNNGEIYGLPAAWGAGRVGLALRFNGSATYIEVPDDDSLDVGPSPDGDFSLDLWIRLPPDADTTGTRVLLDKQSATGGAGYQLYLANSEPGLQLADGSGWSNFGAGEGIPKDDRWHLLAVSVDRDRPDGGRFYLDGMPLGIPFDPTGRPGSLENASVLRLGATSFGETSRFDGWLDEVEVVRSALPAEVVSDLYRAGATGKCAPTATATPQPTVPPYHRAPPARGSTDETWRSGPKGGRYRY